MDDSQWEEWASQTGETYAPEWTGTNCWTITAKIKVTNTGSVAGKDVVEAYFHAPYFTGGVDKSEVSLVAFEKTRTLNHGFGTKSIKMIVEKYGGEVTFGQSGEIFRTNIILPCAA